ncbi:MULTISPECIES: enoyl-CoA hydratase-related protein [unclassified Pseudomonas]|uniref:enoyl-CoA hydratase-related protein n=1 Tax=unclassified Pseudomonas TaxID=196821 RepID=UPI0025EFD6C5|nr:MULTISPECIES: enoyl-CoA hydratase-related protein [unclassified Pseudomonas]
MNNFSVTIDAEGVALITFDVPGKGMNVISFDVQREFAEVVEMLRSNPAIRGAVWVSGKTSGFCAGADLPEIAGRFDDWREATSQVQLRNALAESASWSRHLRALETCGKPVAVAIAGLALGGGLELVLACHYRVAVDDPTLRLAFPEVGVGLLPGAGGTQRLTRLLGISAVLPHLLEGTPIAPADALASGVLHAVLPADQLIDAARRWVLEHPEAQAPWDLPDFQLPGGGVHSAPGYRYFAPALAARVGSSGGRYPAVANILKCVYEGAQLPIEAGLRVESRYFFNTVRSPVAKAMARSQFTARQALAKRESREDLSDYLSQLRHAVATEQQAMVEEGIPPALIANLSRRNAIRAEVERPAAVAQPCADEVDFAAVAELELRLLYTQALTAVRCLENQVVRDPLEADSGALAAGFPVWSGGPVSYIEVQGLEAFVAQAERLASRFPQRFHVPRSLHERAADRRGFHS